MPSFRDLLADAKRQITEVETVEVEARLAKEPVNVLDVREPDEYATARIEGSTLIPLGEVAARAGELPRDTKIVVHCKLGGRSAKAVAALRELGFQDVWNVAGGITAWSKEIDPQVPVY